MHQIVSSAKRGLSRHTKRGLKNTGKVGNTHSSRPTRHRLVDANAKVKRQNSPHRKLFELRKNQDPSRPRPARAGFDRVFAGPLLGKGLQRYSLCFHPVAGKRASTETDIAEGTISNEQKDKQLYGGVKMKSWIRVLTTPTSDTPGTALLLHFDNKRYIIGNVGEGTQRLCVQLGVQMSKVEDILLTGNVSWGTTGGLIGMILTLADATASSASAKAERLVAKKSRDGGIYFDDPSKMRLHGGRNLTHMLATTRKFVFRKGLPIDVHEIKDKQEAKENTDWPPTWSDQNIRVWAMAIQSNASLNNHGGGSRDGGARTQAESFGTGETELKDTKEDLDDQIRRGVVGHMFDSDWRLDSLQEVKLKDVFRPMDTPLFVRNAEGNIEKYNGMIPGGDDIVPDINVLTRTPWPGASILSLPPTTPSNEAMSYIIKNKRQRGKFNAAEAMRLGVKQGPDFRKLTMGQTITTKEGLIVSPDMVLAPSKEGGGIVVAELPNASYIDPLLDRAEWLSEEVMNGIGGVVWILGKGISSDARLKSFMKKFDNLHHLVSSVDLCSDNLVLSGAAKAALKLNLLDSKFFPVPAKQSGTLLPREIHPEAFTVAKPGMVFQLEPKFEFKEDQIHAELDTAEAVQDMDQEAVRLATEAREAHESSKLEPQTSDGREEIPCKDAEVITLGTGSALPSKYRNVSATLVRVPGYGSYLFDCGENTLGQLKRVFGTELPQILRDLKVIWISHLHADHHLGTTSVVKAWHEETLRGRETESNKLTIASDDGMLQWLTEYSQVENYGFDRLSLIPMNLSNELHHRFSESESAIYGLSSIEACRVTHCKGALAAVFTFPNGFKVAYSGDCLPSHNFAKLGHGATLLIHEATFDDDMAEDAQAKKHSTTAGALFVGREMGARRIVLTHFSQRYQKIPLIVEEEEIAGEKGGRKSPARKRRKTEDVAVIVGFDYMRCRLDDFGRMAALRPALAKLYENKLGDEVAEEGVEDMVVETKEVSTVAAAAAAA